MQTMNDVSFDESSATFLSQLANDEELRAAVKRDPVGTLAQFGIEVDPAKVPETIELPSAEDLKGLQAVGANETMWAPFIEGD